VTDERALIEFVTAQRWFGSKTREVTHATVVDRAVLRETDPRLELHLVETRFAEGTHETYQLLTDDTFDALADARHVRELVHMIRRGRSVPAAEGVVQFGFVEASAGLGRELREAHVIAAEQSNTSIVFDDELIMKVFRRLEAGINPELELLRFLTEKGFRNIAQLAGWYAYQGRPMDATLGILQRYVEGGIDGWVLALDMLESDPGGFMPRVHRLGEVTGEMHSVLGSDSSEPNFSPEETSGESLGLLTATVDEQIESIFLELPPDRPELEPIRGRGEEVRERLRQLTYVGGAGRVIRHHGDFHLGQTLWAESGPEAPPTAVGGDWVILDFEGEPARSLPERRRKRSPLRDVAGMLRSFAYVASAAELQRGVEPPPGWEASAREHFLAGYRSTVDQSLVPTGPAMDKLLSVFELEKAVYELRYDLNNRPDWVKIPVAGIVRLLETEVAA
jgi:trehalose synthase-fused probable maltokinase